MGGDFVFLFFLGGFWVGGKWRKVTYDMFLFGKLSRQKWK